MKAILISIQPKWCELIASGKKTIEVRKTAPKLQTPFKCYIYCAQDKYKHLYDLRKVSNGDFMLSVVQHNKTSLVAGGYLNGKVIGEFVCDSVFEYRSEFPEGNYDEIIEQLYTPTVDGKKVYMPIAQNGCDNYLSNDSCLTWDELKSYIGKGIKSFYGWNITDIKIYDKPKELGEFFRPVKYDADGPICGTEKEMQDIIEWGCQTVFNKEFTECTLKDCPKLQELYRIACPPQSWQYCEVSK